MSTNFYDKDKVTSLNPEFYPFDKILNYFRSFYFFFHFDNEFNIILERSHGEITKEIEFTTQVIKNKPLDQFLTKDQYNICLPHLKNIYNGDSSSFIIECFDNRWFLCNLIPLNHSGKEVKGLAAFIDINDFVHLDASFKEIRNIAKLGNWSLDVKAQKFTWSSELFKMFERDPKENSPTLMQFINYLDKDEVKNVISSLNEMVDQKKAMVFDFSIRTEQGFTKYFKFIGKPHKINNNKVSQVIGFIQDNSPIINYQIELEQKTEEIRAQNESLSNTNKELLIAKKNAEESNRLKSAFLENLSHEIRTPLNGIVGFSELLANQDLDLQSKKGYANIIKDSSQQLLNIINNILDVSKIESGQVDKHYSRTNIGAVFSKLAHQYDEKSHKKGLKFEVQDSFPNNEVYIMTDPGKFRQILDNLLNNAIKFTPSGKVVFGNIILDSSIEFFIKDTGIGIKKEDQLRIFDRFIQLNASQNDELSGTGLGLTIARAYTKIMGGEIFLESTPGKGSKFTVKLPTQPYYNKDNVNKITRKHNMYNGETLLVVEDEDVNFYFFKELLAPYSLQCIHAKNGHEAIKICKQRTDIKLVLMDIKMPGMNGFEATKAIKEVNKSIPVIAQTAYSMEESRFKSLEVGCDEFITKPIDVDLLFETLKKYLGY